MSSCTRNICKNRSEQSVDAGKEIDVDQIINFILAKKQQNPGPTYRGSTWTLESKWSEYIPLKLDSLE